MALTRRGAAIHLAIDAVKVTLSVRVHVDAHGQTPGARRNDYVDKPVPQEIHRVAEGSFYRNPRPRLELPVGFCTERNSVGTMRCIHSLRKKP
jgi:hypothetical protein